MTTHARGPHPADDTDGVRDEAGPGRAHDAGPWGSRGPRLLPGGTDPADVAALLAERRAIRGVPGAPGPARPGPRAPDPVPAGGGRRPVLVPVDPAADPAAAAADLGGRVPSDAPVPDAVDVVVQTSGSTTGRGHLVGISAAALRASAEATHARLAGPGRWVLCLATHHIAGLQVLVRSALAGTEPVVVDLAGGFDVGAFVDAALAAQAPDSPAPLYCSVVPTQLVRVLDAAERGPAGPTGRRALDALRAFDAILVGGAATAPDVLDGARALGAAVVTTYGMSETGGGCVYDGRPLDGVAVDVDADGRVLLSGPVVAEGYLDDPAASATTFLAGPGGRRTLRTSDRGEVRAGPDGRPRLRVLGRVDDLITTGGIKVDPGTVTPVIAALNGVAEACVVGVPDPEWGQRVVAVVVPTGRPAGRGVTRTGERAGHRGAGTAPGNRAGTAPGGRPDAGPGEGPGAVALTVAPEAELSRVRAAVRAELSAAHAPRAVLVADALPLRGPGKIDRRAVAAAAARALGIDDSAGTAI